MCFESLINGDATERPLRELLRAETASALKDATIAATVGLTVLLAGGTGPLLTGGAALAALALGFVLHQAVLVAGVALVRWRAAAGRPAGVASS